MECKYLVRNILEPLSLTQIVKKPTRLKSLLDVIIVDNPSLVKISNVVDLPGVSDHSLIYMGYNMYSVYNAACVALEKDE